MTIRVFQSYQDDGTQCKKLTFFAGCKYLLPGLKGNSKLSYLVANIGSHMTAQLPPCQIYDQTTFHMVKGIYNAFDQMELCFGLRKQKNYFSENWLVLPRNYFHNRIPWLQLFATQVFNRWQMGFSGGKFAPCYC